jgi:hypothetical protein
MVVIAEAISPHSSSVKGFNLQLGAPILPVAIGSVEQLRRCHSRCYHFDKAIATIAVFEAQSGN